MTGSRRRTGMNLNNTTPAVRDDDPTSQTASTEETPSALETSGDTATKPAKGNAVAPRMDRAMEPTKVGSNVGAKDSSALDSAELRKARVRGLKLHPRDERSKLNEHVPTYLRDTIRDVSDAKFLRPGQIAALALEEGLRRLFPEEIATAYRDRCQATGARDDWNDEQ